MTSKLQTEIDRVVDILKDKYQPEKIILYGSAIHGKTHEWSDLDLVLVKKTNKRFYDRIGDVLLLLYSLKSETPVDVLVYTPEEYKRMSGESWFIGEEVNKKGKILYQQ
ncbi:nucleotidyltransferase domain-containing protein [Patescibacteria group bacterium]|nr:nucleotidyltransferase domain-containing protein [Patescibacteria group bacterium]